MGLLSRREIQNAVRNGTDSTAVDYFYSNGVALTENEIRIYRADVL